MASAGGTVLRARQKVSGRLAPPFRFGIVGVINTLVGLGAIFTAKALFGAGDALANAIGYAIGLATSFGLNSRWTFRYGGRIAPSILRFGLAFGISYALNLATVFYLRDGAQLNSYLAQAIGIIPYTVAFYLLSKKFVFPDRSTGESDCT